MKKAMIHLEDVKYQSSAYWEMLALRNKVLREPLGLIFSEEDLQNEKDDVFCLCRVNDRIIACCVLSLKENGIIHLRQMAVDEEFQGKGFGSTILQFAEQCVKELCYKTITLHARRIAVGFYAKHGYEIEGDEFIEIGLPHVTMNKIMIDD